MTQQPTHADLDRRSREVFRQIVDGYLHNGEPVGSRNISKQLPMTLSPASVRNVMSDLEAIGLIYAPHTSAGRLPTQSGLRFFVDAMLEVGSLSDDERTQIDKQVNGSAADQPLESLLTEAVSMLSGLSVGAGLVLAQKADIRLKHIEFVRIEPTKALVVMVGEDGRVENRLIELPEGLPASALTEASNFLNAHLVGRTLSEIKTSLDEEREVLRRELDDLTRKVVEEGLAEWAGSQGADDQPTLIVRGRSNLLPDAQVEEELDRVKLLFDDLERKDELIRLLAASELGDGVRIFIGSENKLFSLSGSSMIVSPYRDGDNQIIGALGIIGPTRLNYARIVPMVDYTAKLVSDLISARRTG
ncbi:MAG: heat-inducible transcriptional repressor HrcA [Pseudomonadota bacterium]